MDNNEMKLKYDIKNFSINTKRKKREKWFLKDKENRKWGKGWRI
jgi:hypothetical protein